MSRYIDSPHNSLCKGSSGPHGHKCYHLSRTLLLSALLTMGGAHQTSQKRPRAALFSSVASPTVKLPRVAKSFRCALESMPMWYAMGCAMGYAMGYASDKCLPCRLHSQMAASWRCTIFSFLSFGSMWLLSGAFWLARPILVLRRGGIPLVARIVSCHGTERMGLTCCRIPGMTMPDAKKMCGYIIAGNRLLTESVTFVRLASIHNSLI